MSGVLIIGITAAAMMLALATEKIIRLLEHFCHVTGLKQFAVTAVIIALATSLPELVVSVISAIKGAPEIALGNGIGSNIVNLALVAGITAIWSRVISFHDESEEKVLIWPIVASFLPFLLLLDGRIGRRDGVLLLVVYGFYVWKLLGSGQKKKTEEEVKFENKKVEKIAAEMVVWVGVLLASAGMAVAWAKNLAEAVGLPLIFVGLFVVAIGTSLPELVFNLAAIKHRQKKIALGNIVGSNITNATLIVGLAAIIRPFDLGTKLVWTTGLQYFFVAAAFLTFVSTKKKLERWEGVILVLLFVYYTVIELMIR